MTTKSPMPRILVIGNVTFVEFSKQARATARAKQPEPALAGITEAILENQRLILSLTDLLSTMACEAQTARSREMWDDALRLPRPPLV